MRLIEKMQADVSARIESILSEAKKKASEIEAEAKAEIESLEKEARVASFKRLDLEKARGSAKVLQSIKQQEAELKRNLIEKVFEKARKQLEELDGDAYGKLFEKLAEEAFKDLGDSKFVAVVREGDKDRITKALKTAKIQADVEETLDGQGGGLLLHSDDGRVFIDNTLFTRLDRARVDGVTMAGKILFSAE
jgi:vacuolar-type H+-ATPase subunit E/Vma4